jgi:hypothetical protein
MNVRPGCNEQLTISQLNKHFQLNVASSGGVGEHQKVFWKANK